MAVVMEYQSGSSSIIVRDDYIEETEMQKQLLRNAHEIEVREEYRRYLEERKRAMEESNIEKGSET